MVQGPGVLVSFDGGRRDAAGLLGVEEAGEAGFSPLASSRAWRAQAIRAPFINGLGSSCPGSRISSASSGCGDCVAGQSASFGGKGISTPEPPSHGPGILARVTLALAGAFFGGSRGSSGKLKAHPFSISHCTIGAPSAAISSGSSQASRALHWAKGSFDTRSKRMSGCSSIAPWWQSAMAAHPGRFRPAAVSSCRSSSSSPPGSACERRSS